MKCIMDIETNGFYEAANTIWIAVCKDLDKDEIVSFSDYDQKSRPLSEFTEYLSKAEAIIGHNIIGFDLPVVHKILKWEPRPDQKLIDTMIISQLNNYRREGKHSLKNFGQILEDNKIDYQGGFDKFSQEMKEYCIQDVQLNHKVYKYVTNEAKQLIENRPKYKKSLQLEHSIANICANQIKNKWKFDITAAKALYEKLTADMKVIEDELEPKLKPRKIWKDTEDKFPKYLKNGLYTTVTCRMLSEIYNKEVLPTDINIHPADKPFRRFTIIPADLGNMEQVKAMLQDEGWEPTQFTPKGEPKITDDSLENLETDTGQKLKQYYSMRSRHSVLKGWIELAEQNNGRVYVEPFNIGTPTGRQRHSKIVNVPNAGAYLGKELRALFMADEGKVMVGCDSSGNQIRALAHYLNNKELNNYILNGDIHSRTAEIVGVPRQLAKSVLYATVFGAGFAKLGKLVSGKEDLDLGRDIKGKLYTAFPGLKQLLERLNKFFYTTQNGDGLGWIPGLDGRKIYAESSFKLLNYLLQCYEAVTVKGAIVNAFKMFKEENLNVDMLAMVHDEVQVQTLPEQSKRVSEILEYSFGDFITKEWELNIPMAGEAKVGKNWAECH